MDRELGLVYSGQIDSADNFGWPAHHDKKGRIESVLVVLSRKSHPCKSRSAFERENQDCRCEE